MTMLATLTDLAHAVGVPLCFAGFLLLVWLAVPVVADLAIARRHRMNKGDRQ